MTDYFSALKDRRDDAVLLEIRAVAYANGDRPSAGKCHDNVDRWVAENQGDKAVRGWLAMDYGLERHSAVETQDGVLIEITLPNAYPFLRHEGPETIFDDIGARSFNQVLWCQIRD